MANVSIDPNTELAIYWVIDCSNLNAPSKFWRRAPAPDIIVFHTAICGIEHGVWVNVCAMLSVQVIYVVFFFKQCMICVTWLEDGRNAAETCCHEPLICSTL
jgi:hypothetical protein